MFTRKENNLFRVPYFKTIREEEWFIEVQSINTGHCWIVQNSQFASEQSVVLHHKHKRTDTYYHKHRLCNSVKEAVDQIKSHDEYVLEQIAIKKECIDKAAKSARQLKVYESSGYKYRPVPTIVLKGEWLKDWGFDSGNEVDVTYSGDGVITIKNK